jgi:hypothetical protein
MPDHAPKYTIRDDYDPDDEMPTDTDPVEAYQTYVDDRDADYGDRVYAGRLRAVHRRNAAAQKAKAT